MIKDQALEQQIGAMIIMGFQGLKPDDPEVEVISSYLAENRLGGVILYDFNIQNSAQVKALNSKFKQANQTCFISVDQEGGLVERLSKTKGFHGFPAAKQIAKQYTLAEAQNIYEIMARELQDHDFNLNFGPVSDLDDLVNPCPVIGAVDRSYSNEVDIIVAYNKAFITAHLNHSILNAIKHFPGHGLAKLDTHIELTDVTDTAKSEELEVFYKLIDQSGIDIIMTAHIVNQNLDKEKPITLSSTALKTLLRDKGYDGIIISDDLHMGAIVKNFGFKESVIDAINAGCDMLIISNNKNACKGKDFNRDIHINLEVIKIVKNAIDEGKIDRSIVEKAYSRIMKLRAKL